MRTETVVKDDSGKWQAVGEKMDGIVEKYGKHEGRI